MKRVFFSRSTKGFYIEEINKNVPDDVVEISHEKYEELLNKSYNCRIEIDENGFPYSGKEIEIKQDDAKEEVIIKRNILLSESDWTILPDAPFTKVQKDEWKIYRQALRDITEQEGFPENVVFPEAPDFKKTAE